MAATLRTPLVRFCFPELFVPKHQSKNPKPDAKPVYSLMMLFTKEAQQTKEYKAIEAAIEETIREKYPVGKPLPKGFKHPIKRGDQLCKTDGTRYKGCEDPDTVVISANSQYAPEVLNRLKQKLTKENGADQIYSGCWGYATVQPVLFDVDGNKGAKLWLGNVLKFKDDTNLAGKRSADKEFEDIQIDEASEVDDLFPA